MVLDQERRLQFERQRIAFRLALLGAPALLYLVYGAITLDLAVMMAIAVLATSMLIWFVSNNFPAEAARIQLLFRLADIVLIFIILHYLDLFLRTSQYNFVYILPVIAATATHGRAGLFVTGGAATLAVLIERLLMDSASLVQFNLVQAGDVAVNALIFFLTGFFVDLLNRQRDIAEGNVKKHSDYAQALVENASIINSTLDLNEVLGVICRTSASVLKVDVATISRLDPELRQLAVGYAHGIPQELARRLAPLPLTTLDEFSKLYGATAIVPDIQKLEGLPNAKIYAKMDLRTTVGTRIVHEGQLMGRLNIGVVGKVREFDSDELYVLEGLAHQAALAIANATLYEAVKNAKEQITAAYDATLEGWVKALDLRDSVTQDHTQRVTELTVRLARRLGAPEEELIHIRRGALLHDIGKIGIPDSVLNKPGSLSGDEWRLMERHPEFARSMLESIEYLRPALDIPYSHHERWDGTGYPCGLKGTEIPLTARIFAVVDVWDALLSDRPYRKSWTEKAVHEYLRNESGKQFDPRVVEVFLKVLAEDRGHPQEGG